MGITKNDCKLLFYAKDLNVSFEKTLMLGRLNFFATKDDLRECITKYKNNVKNIDDVPFPDEYAEPVFKILGAQTVDSLDISHFEKATIIHDLNKPMGPEMYNRFTCIVDGGTIEHVFDFPTAIKNCMKALAVGGHYIGVTPANNEMGHGFYQFSPELWYRVFSEENGFRVKKMFITLSNNDGRFNWYEVADPKKVNSRVTLVNNEPLMVMFIAEKLQDKEIFETSPQQIDYVSQWNSGVTLSDKIYSKRNYSLKTIYGKLPEGVRRVLRNVYDLYRYEKFNKDGLGTINPKHFRKVEL